MRIECAHVTRSAYVAMCVLLEVIFYYSKMVSFILYELKCDFYLTLFFVEIAKKVEAWGARNFVAHYHV